MQDYFLLVLVFLIAIFLVRLFFKVLLCVLSRLYMYNRAKRIKNRKDKPIDLKIENKPKIIKKQETIVDIAKPVGVWSSLILGNEISKVFNDASGKHNMKNFWENLAETQARKSIKK